MRLTSATPAHWPLHRPLLALLAALIAGSCSADPETVAKLDEARTRLKALEGELDRLSEEERSLAIERSGMETQTPDSKDDFDSARRTKELTRRLTALREEEKTARAHAAAARDELTTYRRKHLKP